MEEIDDDFERIWSRERDRLWRIAYLIAGQAELADDIVAAAGARAWRGWGRRGVSNPEAYLRRAVANEATDRFRHRARERRWIHRRTGEGRGQRSVDDQVSDHLDLADALAELPVGQRAVLVLRFWGDLSEAATAEALAISVGTVKSRTSRALASLAVHLEPADARAARSPRPSRRRTMPDPQIAIDEAGLEARLRAGLADLAASAPDPARRGIDLDAPLRAHRLQFERRRRFLVGAVATTAAAGVSGMMVLNRNDEVHTQVRTGVVPEPQADSATPVAWQPIGPAPLSPRGTPLVATLGDDRLVVWSGASPGVPNAHPPDGAIWSSTARSWSPMRDAPAGAVTGNWVSGPAAIGSRVTADRSFAVWDGSELIVGLIEADSAAPWNRDVGPAWEAQLGIGAYVPREDSWRYVAPIDAETTAILGPSWQAVTVPGGVLVATRAAMPLETVKELLHLDPVTGGLRPLPLGPFETWGAASGSGIIDLVAVGDRVVATTEWDPRPWVFDPASETWRTASAPPELAPGLALATSIGERAAFRLRGEPEVRYVFDPSAEEADAWRPVAANPFPPTPWSWDPVWSGSELFVPGAAYDPATDAWRAIPGPPLADPAPRNSVRARWLDGGLALVGGTTDRDCERSSCRGEAEILDGWFLPAG